MWLIFHHWYNLRMREDHRSLVVAVKISHSNTYIKNSLNVPHLEYSKYISELFEIEHLEKA